MVHIDPIKGTLGALVMKIEANMLSIVRNNPMDSSQRDMNNEAHNGNTDAILNNGNGWHPSWSSWWFEEMHSAQTRMQSKLKHIERNINALIEMALALAEDGRPLASRQTGDTMAPSSLKPWKLK
jgi:hypothetical protein